MNTDCKAYYWDIFIQGIHIKMVRNITIEISSWPTETHRILFFVVPF